MLNGNNENNEVEPKSKIKRIIFWVLVALFGLILVYSILIWILNYIY